jgi:6-pyruvoyltetrahydropterin/6-carboxytetrahydropterin synthase
MVYRVAVRASYDVALRIPGEEGAAGRTHGHRYTAEAVLAADGLDRQGFVADFDRVQAGLSAIAAELDHRFLNELEAFEGGAPSAERQAEYFYRRLSEAIHRDHQGVRLVRVRVIQEPDAWAEYEP